MKKSFYKWHRIIGLIALIPVIGWTLSGLSHPFMSNWFRPGIPQETYKPQPFSKLQTRLSLQQILEQNHIDSLRNFNLVKFNQKTYYQIFMADSSYHYYAAADGRLLPDGDRQYALFLARYFTQDSTSKISSITLQTRFDGQYQPINHLLPVWKVSFDRPDHMDIYVETAQSRMGTFNNTTRKVFLNIFEQLHTWNWLAALGGERLRIIVLLGVVTILFLAMISGLTIYGLFWKRFKEISLKRKDKGSNNRRFVHRFHRQLGLAVSLVMFTFLVSAGFHLWVKLGHLQLKPKVFKQIIYSNNLKQSNLKLSIADSIIRKAGLVCFNKHVYYQLLTTKKQMLYADALDGHLLPHGDEIFATYLAGYYSNHSENKPKLTAIKQFTQEYGFINKRLPVMQVSYPGQDNWYIETSTQQLAAHVAGIDRTEGFSFIFLHKYFGMTWAGKDIRDLVSMLSALGVLVVSLFGFWAFVKNKRL